MEPRSVDVVHRRLPYQLLTKITDSFSKERKLGSGAFGTVYKGECEDGETIAVKLIHDNVQFDDKAFDKEYLHLARLQHKNIVRVVGYCHETQRECVQYNGEYVFAENIQRALCFEYMEKGSLHNYLSDESRGHDWKTRYQIIKGICEGLKYLHESSHPPMYHLDLKPANVLLDQNLVPKIADFGMSRLIGGEKMVDQKLVPDFGTSRLIGGEKTLLTKSGAGTLGYQPPEYIDDGLISDKFDIFSLGVVIIKIMTGPMSYFRTAEMPCQEFIELVHANWRNRLLITSEHSLQSSSQQVKRCIELALSCVEANRRERPCIGVICNKLTETEDMIRIPHEISKQESDDNSDWESDEISYRELDHHNYVTVSRDHIIALFNSTNQRLSDVPENPWILKAGTETFAGPHELTTESSRIWAMKLKTTAELVGLSKQELDEHNWELCEEVREKCLEQLLEVVYSFSDAGWSVVHILHQLTIFDAIVHVLFNIQDLHFNRSCEAAGILNKMVTAFKGVMQGTSIGFGSRIESAIHPATAVLVQVLEFFNRNKEMVLSILESGDFSPDPWSDVFNSWVCKVNENAELMLFQEKRQRNIVILNDLYYILQRICRPGLLLPNVVSKLRSLIQQYTKSYLDECWVPPMLLYLDGDSLEKAPRSSLDKFTEEFLTICHDQMQWKVQHELKYILRKEIEDLIVPNYEKLLKAEQGGSSVLWKSWFKKPAYTAEQLGDVIAELFES